MILREFKYLEFLGSVKEPLTNNRFTITNRAGIIIKLTTDDNHSTYGEASPLAGFSVESYKDVLVCILKIKKMFDEKGSVNSDEILLEAKHLPSLLFAIESALHGIDYQSTPDLFRDFTIRVNDVVGMNDLERTLRQIHDSLAIGIDTFKIKIGRPNFDDDLSIIQCIVQEHPDIKLRLDVNGAWSYDESLEHIARLMKYNIEYIEQPVSKLDELISLAGVSTIPIAPDESLACYDDAKRAIENPNIKFVVIKPGMFGFNNTLKLIMHANDNNVAVIISSIFESEVGKSNNLYLASLCKLITAHGLMPELITDSFQVVEKLTFNNGYLQLNKNVYPPKFQLIQDFV